MNGAFTGYLEEHKVRVQSVMERGKGIGQDGEDGLAGFFLGDCT